MRSVTVRVLAADLAREMVAMRSWLDSSGYEPTRFDCDQRGADVVVSIDFKLDEAAAAFASHFVAGHGRQGPAPAAADSSRQSAT